MASDTITLPRQSTPAAWSEPATTEQPASPVTGALTAPGESETAAPAAAERESDAPPNPPECRQEWC